MKWKSKTLSIALSFILALFLSLSSVLIALPTETKAFDGLQNYIKGTLQFGKDYSSVLTNDDEYTHIPEGDDVFEWSIIYKFTLSQNGTFRLKMSAKESGIFSGSGKYGDDVAYDMTTFYSLPGAYLYAIYDSNGFNINYPYIRNPVYTYSSATGFYSGALEYRLKKGIYYLGIFPGYGWSNYDDDSNTYYFTYPEAPDYDFTVIPEFEPEVIIPDTEVSLSQTSLSLDVGSAEQLTATVTPSSVDRTCNWETSDSSVATVSDGYVEAVGAGTATITAYSSDHKAHASCTVTVKSADKKSIAKATISGIKNKTYTGKAITQNLTLKLGSNNLNAGTDYTVSYKNNKNVGTATITITGKGNYTGQTTATFKIKKAANSLKVKARKKTYNIAYSKLAKKDQGIKQTQIYNISKNGQGKLSYTLFSAKNGKKKFKTSFAVDKKTGKLTVKKGLKKGTYSVDINVIAAGDKNHNKATKKITISVKVK